MKKISLLGLVLLFTGCVPTEQNIEEQQRNYICKSLINGFLQAQQLGQYEFHNKKIESNKEYYTYQQPTVSGMVLGIPKNLEIRFECLEKSLKNYELKILDDYSNSKTILRIHFLNKKSL